MCNRDDYVVGICETHRKDVAPSLSILCRQSSLKGTEQLRDTQRFTPLASYCKLLRASRLESWSPKLSPSTFEKALWGANSMSASFGSCSAVLRLLHHSVTKASSWELAKVLVYQVISSWAMDNFWDHLRGLIFRRFSGRPSPSPPHLKCLICQANPPTYLYDLTASDSDIVGEDLKARRNPDQIWVLRSFKRYLIESNPAIVVFGLCPYN